MCDTIYSSQRPPGYTITKLYSVWLSAVVQSQIEPLPIPLINKETDNVSKCDIINIKVCWNPSDTDSETYKIKIVMFEHGQPEELLALMNNFNRAIDTTGTTLEAGRINYLPTILSG